MNVQLYVSGSPLASELALPFNVMRAPVVTLPMSGPALATGAVLVVAGGSSGSEQVVTNSGKRMNHMVRAGLLICIGMGSFAALGELLGRKDKEIS